MPTITTQHRGVGVDPQHPRRGRRCGAVTGAGRRALPWSPRGRAGRSRRSANSRCSASSSLNTQSRLRACCGHTRVHAPVSPSPSSSWSVLTSCGSDKRPGAAEPATAPAPSTSPAGTVHQVGDSPEGIVYDADDDTIAVAVRDPARLLLLDPTTLRVTRGHSAARHRAPPATRSSRRSGTGPGRDRRASWSRSRCSDGRTRSRRRRSASSRTTPPASPAARSSSGTSSASSISFLVAGRVCGRSPGPQQPGGSSAIGKTSASWTSAASA